VYPNPIANASARPFGRQTVCGWFTAWKYATCELRVELPETRSKAHSCSHEECRKGVLLVGSGSSVTDNYTHTFTDDERNAAEKLGELFGTGWPEIDAGKVISFPNLSQKEEGLAGGVQQALVNQ